MHQDISSIESKIQSFWQWFVETEDAIQEYFTDDEMVDKAALVEAMDEQVLDFGLFAWEIGPGVGRQFYLTISPNGSRERLKISKMIMESAPNLPDWEFNYARPARKEGLAFSVYDDFMVEQEVDAAPWQFVLLPNPEGRVEVILEAPNASHLDPDTQLAAGKRVVNNLLGEEVVIDHVYRVRVVEELEEEYTADRASILTLRQQLASIE